MGYLLLFVFFIAICFIVGWNTLGWILIAGSVGLIILMIVVSFQEAERKKLKQEQDEEKKIELAKQKEIEKQDYEKWKSELVEKYGQIDKEITLLEDNKDNVILVFSKVSRIWLIGNDLPMSSILSCNLSDASKTIKGKSTIQTKTNTGNMAKRAVVGGVLLGGAGALAGGVTAKKDGTIIQEGDKIIHDYTVLVNIDSLSTPIIRLQCGTNGTLANEIIGLLNVIINRNNKG